VVMDGTAHPRCPYEEEEVEDAWDGGDEVAGVLFCRVGVGVFGPLGVRGGGRGVGAEEAVEGWEVGFGGGG